MAHVHQYVRSGLDMLLPELAAAIQKLSNFSYEYKD